MKRSIQPSSLCLQCKCSEARHEDLANGLVFCTPECQSDYHRYDANAIAKSRWGERRRRFYIRHLIEGTDITTKYMLLCELCEICDIRRYMMMEMVVSPHVLKTYLHPPLITTEYSTLYMIGGNGLLNKWSMQGGDSSRVYHGLPKVSILTNGQMLPVLVMHHIPGEHNINPSFEIDRNSFDMCSDDNIPVSSECKVSLELSLRINAGVANESSLLAKGATFGKFGFGARIHLRDYCQIPCVIDPYIIERSLTSIMYVDIDGQLWIITRDVSMFDGSLCADIPTRIKTKSRVISLSCRTDYAMFVTIDGNLWVIGRNTNCMTGMGPGSNQDPKKKPIHVTGIPSVCHVHCGLYCTLIIDTNGRLWATGENNHRGILGIGDLHNRDVFERVPDIYDVVSVYCTKDATFVICADDSRWIATDNYCPFGIKPTRPYFFSRIQHLPPLSLIDREEERVTKRQCIL